MPEKFCPNLLVPARLGWTTEHPLMRQGRADTWTLEQSFAQSHNLTVDNSDTLTTAQVDNWTGPKKAVAGELGPTQAAPDRGHAHGATLAARFCEGGERKAKRRVRTTPPGCPDSLGKDHSRCPCRLVW